MRKAFFFLIISLICVTTSFSSKVLKFPNADVYYEVGYKAIAVDTGRIFEKIRPLAIDLVGNDPGRINIIIKNIGTVTNGYAVPQYHKSITIYTWPPDSYIATRLNSVSWFRQVIMHEFTHIVHLTHISGVNRFITNFFTGSELLSPQYFTPFCESVTLLAESSVHFAEGRLNNPIWSRGMYLSSLKGNYFPDLAYVLAVNDEDYRGGFLYYNYPAGFYKHLIERFGLSKVREFHSIVSEMPPVLGIIIASNKAFEKDINKLYNDWKETLSQEFPLKQSQFNEVFIASNGNITDIWSDDRLYFSYATMGNASSWENKHKIRITSLNDKDKFSEELKGVLPIRTKSDNGVLILMQNEAEGRKFTRVLWKKDSKGWKEIYRGNITAFEIDNGDIYVAIYDQKNRKSALLKNNSFLLETGFHIKDIEASENGTIALMVDDEKRQGSIALMKSGTLELILDDPILKSSSIEWFNKKIIFTAAYNDNFMDAYSFDPETKKLFQISEGLFLEKVVSFNNKIYGIGNSFEDKGMSIFELETIQREISIPDFAVEDKSVNTDFVEGNFLIDSAKYFVNPVIYFPYAGFNNINDYSLGFGTIHVDPFEKHRLILNGNYNFGKEQFVFSSDYNYRMTKRLSTQLNMELTLPSTITGTLSLEYLVIDKILKPGITLNGILAGTYNTEGIFKVGLGNKITGDCWSIYLNPSMNFTIDSVGLELSGSISMAPTLNTLVKGSFYTGTNQWIISAVQNLFDIYLGRVPWFFTSEVALGTRIYGELNNFNLGVIYITMGINDTWGFGIKMYPKIGVSLDDEFDVSLFLELTSQP
ncbi:MAG: hypothetical protein R6U52_08050 [Kosmotogaceae bacterium]